MDARGPESGEVPYFEQALTDAMHSATPEVGPVAVDVARLHRRARAWRSASVVAFATGAACLLAAATAALATGDLSLLPRPAGEVALASVTPTVTGTTGLSVVSAPRPSDASASSPAPTLAGEEPTAAGTPAVPALPAAPGGTGGDGGEDDGSGPGSGGGGVGSGDADERREGCVAVPDGSAAVRDLVLDTARQQVDAWLERYDGRGGGGGGDGDDDDGDDDGPPGWLRDLSERELLERLDMADVIDEVERDDVVDCGGRLRYAAPGDGDLDEVVAAAVADELADELPGGSRADSDDDDSDDDDLDDDD